MRNRNSKRRESECVKSIIDYFVNLGDNKTIYLDDESLLNLNLYMGIIQYVISYMSREYVASSDFSFIKEIKNFFIIRWPLINCISRFELLFLSTSIFNIYTRYMGINNTFYFICLTCEWQCLYIINSNLTYLFKFNS